MATADELLSAEMCDDILTVDLDSRIIIIPKNVTNIGVENDNLTKVFHFRVPRHYCGVDLGKFSIRVNYENAQGEGDVYEVENAVIEDELIKFDWPVGRHAVTKRGDVTFILCFKDLTGDDSVIPELNTTIASLPVLPGLETGAVAIQEYTDILEQWRSKLFGSGDTIEQQIYNAGDEVLSNISESVNKYVSDHVEELTGPQGPKGDKGDTGATGPKGDKGDTGASINSVDRTNGDGAPGTVDTYTITLTDGRTSNFYVYNGADGDMMRSTYDPQGRSTDIFAYVDNRIGEIDMILDNINGE